MTTQELFACRAIVDHYGADDQRNILIEECGELVQAAAKLNRPAKDDAEKLKRREHFVEELADVSIMVEQMKSSLTVSERKKFNDFVAYKIMRQLERIQNE